MKNERPMIELTHTSMTRRSYTVSEDAANLLETYASFLADFTKIRVSPGDIIGKLALRLRRDDLFTKWQLKTKSKENPGNAKSKNIVQGGESHV